MTSNIISDKNENLTAESKLLSQMSRLENILDTLKDKRKTHNPLLAAELSEVQATNQRELAKWQKEVLSWWKRAIIYLIILGPKREITNGEKPLKARLYGRGLKDKQTFQIDSPMCCKEYLHLACCIIAIGKWPINY